MFKKTYFYRIPPVAASKYISLEVYEITQLDMC